MEVEESQPSKAQSPTSNGANNKQQPPPKEGSFLLGAPTFMEIGNGRLRCNETGHELPLKETETYTHSKACRLALIDAAVANKKPPLTMFRQCPISKSKLVCKLTGDTINKTEEHIWKHISGKRFQNKLEQKEMEKVASPEKTERKSKKSKKLPESSVNAIEEDDRTDADVNASLEGNLVEKISDAEEPYFWIPPVGERWDFDDGKDRWEDDTSSEHDVFEDGLEDGVDKQHELESTELSMRTKRMSIAVGPSSFASRKKKIKRASPNDG